MHSIRKEHYVLTLVFWVFAHRFMLWSLKREGRKHAIFVQLTHPIWGVVSQKFQLYDYPDPTNTHSTESSDKYSKKLLNSTYCENGIWAILSYVTAYLISRLTCHSHPLPSYTIALVLRHDYEAFARLFAVGRERSAIPTRTRDSRVMQVVYVQQTNEILHIMRYLRWRQLPSVLLYIASELLAQTKQNKPQMFQDLPFVKCATPSLCILHRAMLQLEEENSRISRRWWTESFHEEQARGQEDFKRRGDTDVKSLWLLECLAHQSANVSQRGSTRLRKESRSSNHS